MWLKRWLVLCGTFALWVGCTSGGSLGTYRIDDTGTSDEVDTVCVDQDGDGFCVPSDCQDSDSAIHPGAWENLEDFIDNNCDGLVDIFVCTGDPAVDCDSDGFVPATGDCRDSGVDALYINPDAVEDLGIDGLGDDVDNDCDGLTDELPELCDCPGLGASADDLARAIGLCESRFYSSANLEHTSPGWPNDGEPYPATTPDMAVDTIDRDGTGDCLVARQGCEMAVIATGPLNGQNPNNAPWQTRFMGQFCSDPGGLGRDPLPAYQGTELVVEVPAESCDRTQLRLELTAPSNATGFSFDFVFGSSEYDEYLGQQFNDTFYAIMEYDQLNAGATTNIAFDINGNEIEVNSNYFENLDQTCDETGSVWSPDVVDKSGTTGWLRTTWPVDPGDSFVLTFSIHDEEDYARDSVVFIDNWQWLTVPVEPQTVIIGPE